MSKLDDIFDDMILNGPTEVHKEQFKDLVLELIGEDKDFQMAVRAGSEAWGQRIDGYNEAKAEVRQKVNGL